MEKPRKAMLPNPKQIVTVRLSQPQPAAHRARGSEPPQHRPHSFSEAQQEVLSGAVTGSFLLEWVRHEEAIGTVEKDIHQLQLPVRVITENRRHSQTYLREIAGAQLAIIPSAGHALLQSDAGEMAKPILAFSCQIQRQLRQLRSKN